MYEIFVDCVLGAKKAPVRGNQSSGIQRILPLLFLDDSLSLRFGSVWNLLCHDGSAECRCILAVFPILEWGTIAPVLQRDAQHVGYANISMWHLTK